MGENRRLCHPQLFIENTSRIGLEGPNGTGKSTLISAIMARLHQVASSIPTVYMPQELSTEKAQELLAELKELPSVDRGRVLSLVARLNSDPDRILSGDKLSPGELRKILLATSVLQEPQLIIMDEPTNHLDLQSVEALEAVLADCPCALVLVSHDGPFLDALCKERWVFNLDGEVRIRYA